VNKYCSLLARVALQSANLSLANYFNNSLTIKRIEMMRTIKSKINRWKLVAVAAVIPGLFFFVACQEQIDEGIADIAQNSSMALLVPEKIQTKFDQLKNEHPDKKYVLLELNDAASSKLQKLEEDYGLPASISVYKSDDEHFEKTGEPTITGEASGVILNQLTSESSESIDRSAIHKDGVMNERERTFAIIEYNQQTRRIANASREGTVFTVVEEQPEFPGGFDEMKNFIKSNLKYPRESRMKGEEGTVYVSFIVETDGSISEVRTMRGISPLCDNEAMQVVKLFPKWVPGKQAGEVVRVKFVLPIRFQL
jgi:TonB family protein